MPIIIFNLWDYFIVMSTPNIYDVLDNLSVRFLKQISDKLKIERKWHRFDLISGIVNNIGNHNINQIINEINKENQLNQQNKVNKIDNTDLVTSVNGQTGAVSLTTDDVPEGIINLYYLGYWK